MPVDQLGNKEQKQDNHKSQTLFWSQKKGDPFFYLPERGYIKKNKEGKKNKIGRADKNSE